MKLTSMKIAKAKRTRFGRFLCRVLGDERGAVMMEYVVLGVLVVAAAVAVTLVFGKQIRDNFQAMVLALQGKQKSAVSLVEKNAKKNQKMVKTAQEQGKKTAGNELPE